MSMFLSVKSKCPKCGSEEKFGFWATWTSFNGSHAPMVENRCAKCGAELKEDDPYSKLERKAYKLNLEEVCKQNAIPSC